MLWNVSSGWTAHWAQKLGASLLYKWINLTIIHWKELTGEGPHFPCPGSPDNVKYCHISFTSSYWSIVDKLSAGFFTTAKIIILKLNYEIDNELTSSCDNITISQPNENFWNQRTDCTAIGCHRTSVYSTWDGHMSIWCTPLFQGWVTHVNTKQTARWISAKRKFKTNKKHSFYQWFINMKINLVHILLLEVSEIDGKIAKAIIERKIISEHSS